MAGNWEINVVDGKLPQKVASAVAGLGEKLIGAEYTPIAYLGSQVVNGTNHAVLAKQIVTTGRDTKNIVVLVFNEKPHDTELALVRIENVVNGGDELGGVAIDVKTEFPEDAVAAWHDAFDGFVGSKVEPFAYLGSQVVKGIDHIFIAEVCPVVENPVKKIAIVVVNSLTKTASFMDILSNKLDATLGYAFTWL